MSKPKKDKSCIGVIGRKGGNHGASSSEINLRIRAFTDFLLHKGHRVVMDTETFTNYAHDYKPHHDLVHVGDLDYLARELEHYADMLVVFGGDGTLLNVARTMAKWDRSPDILGINHGKVGFITDMPGASEPKQIYDVINGNSWCETRTVLRLWAGDKPCREVALNEILMKRGDGRILEFEVHIDGVFAYSTRADGVMVSTPTGSTAYAMSAGAPIIHPCAKVFEIVPMLPQTMSYRPIVISDTSSVTIKLLKGTGRIFADGNEVEMIVDNLFKQDPRRSFTIKKTSTPVMLMHPNIGYDYLNTLREKLNWHLEPGK